MTWLAWRQARTQTMIAAAVLAVLGVVLAVSGHGIATMYSDSGAGTCTNDCPGVVRDFLQQVSGSVEGTLYQVASVVMYLVPALFGAFFGAPLVARELEAGTHQLAWNQSVTRTRWLATRLGVAAVVAAGATGLLSWGVTAWAHHLDRAHDNRITVGIFAARGIVPIGYALFAVVLGVAAGMLIRRAVPAMAATLAVYVVAILAMPLGLRAHLAPARHTIGPLDVNSVQEISSTVGGDLRVLGGEPHGSWVLNNRTLTPAGQLFTGPADPRYCGPAHGPRSCLNWIDTLGLRQDLTYQPASHFWPLQFAETGVFLAAAVVLTGFCFWWVRRRLS